MHSPPTSPFSLAISPPGLALCTYTQDAYRVELATAKEGTEKIHPTARTLKRAAEESVHYIICGDRARHATAAATMSTELAALVALLGAERCDGRGGKGREAGDVTMMCVC